MAVSSPAPTPPPRLLFSLFSSTDPIPPLPLHLLLPQTQPPPIPTPAPTPPPSPPFFIFSSTGPTPLSPSPRTGPPPQCPLPPNRNTQANALATPGANYPLVMGSQHPSPNVKNFPRFEPQIWPEIITSRDAESTCFKGSRSSCDVITFRIFWPNFGRKKITSRDGCFLPKLVPESRTSQGQCKPPTDRFATEQQDRKHGLGTHVRNEDQVCETV